MNTDQNMQAAMQHGPKEQPTTDTDPDTALGLHPAAAESGIRRAPKA